MHGINTLAILRNDSAKHEYFISLLAFIDTKFIAKFSFFFSNFVYFPLSFYYLSQFLALGNLKPRKYFHLKLGEPLYPKVLEILLFSDD